MIKIKDDVDMNILVEKYGYNIFYNQAYQREPMPLWYEKHTNEDNTTLVQILMKNRIICFIYENGGDIEKSQEFLFDLINDGLVEKVSE